MPMAVATSEFKHVYGFMGSPEWLEEDIAGNFLRDSFDWNLLTRWVFQSGVSRCCIDTRKYTPCPSLPNLYLNALISTAFYTALRSVLSKMEHLISI
ncbi:uncharacterized protein N7500_000504 [Penicillium coprophilum]|uniref:uncharacterized protein n=1 Tax=Penicillium coprophilum TaxID=36646 RepID=UPI00239EC2D6|nr:uncharacterized protein N7500_000504 [Penicillium coprophilum]KAJ5177805.1 hypothetical protein N7500_000504 [Penicillium coprophilum]